MVGRRRDEVLDDIRESGKPVRGVRRAGLSDFQTHLEAIIVDDIYKLVSSDEIVPLEVSLVHIPEFDSADTGIFLADFPDELQRKGTLGSPAQCHILIPLIICLL